MKLVYDANYWQDYYDGPYEKTFHLAFPLANILEHCWDGVYDERPKSFADIGCGPGQTLQVARKLLPLAEVYGIECQELPPDKIVDAGVIVSDFLDISKRLKPVDLLYVACTMYVPWKDQGAFIDECLRLTNKMVCFANVYLSDRNGIPHDTLRQVIYKSPETFAKAIEQTGSFKAVPGPHDCFKRTGPSTKEPAQPKQQTPKPAPPLPKGTR